MTQWQAVSIGQLQHQLVTSSKLFCNQSWVSHVGYLHEGTASASARRLSITATGSNRCHGEMYFDIVLVCDHQREKRTPPETNNKTTTGETGGGQVMQLSLHDMTGQSWVSHVGPSFSVFFPFFWGGASCLVGYCLLALFFFKGGGEIQGQCDQSITKLIDI